MEFSSPAPHPPLSRRGGRRRWTRLEAICRGRTVTIKINGVVVNQAVDVFPGHGKILLQNEGHEVYFRNFTISPLKETK